MEQKPNIPFSNQYKKYSKSITPFITSQKTKNYSTVIFFFLVLSVFGWYAIRPTIQTILYLRREIRDKTDVDKKMDQKIYALIEANAAYENNESLFPLLTEALPPSPEALDLVTQINSVARSNNLLLSSLQMTNLPLATPSATTNPKTKSTQPYIGFPITFTIEGKYPSVVAFLRQLVDMRRVATIQTMNFVPVKVSGVQATNSAVLGSITVTINLLSYYETK